MASTGSRSTRFKWVSFQLIRLAHHEWKTVFDFVPHIGRDLHAILNHFPIAFLVLSFVCVFVKRRWPSCAQMEWNLFWLGTVLCWPATVSGVVSHFPYEHLPIHETMELHQFPALLGTFTLTALLVLRFRSRRKSAASGVRELGDTNKWLIVAVAGLFWIFIVGGTGGSLTYDHGINVRGVNPLQQQDSDSVEPDEASSVKPEE